MFFRSFLSGRIQFILPAIFLLPAHSQSGELRESVSGFQIRQGMEGDDPMTWVLKKFSRSHVISPPQDGSPRR